MDLTQLSGLTGIDPKAAGKGIEIKPPDAGQFLKDFITKQLPKHIVTGGMSLVGRDDGSGMLTHRLLQTGQDPNFLGGILQP